MRTTLKSFAVALGLFLVGLQVAVAQTASPAQSAASAGAAVPAQGAQAAEPVAGNVRQANEALIRVLNDPESRQALIDLLRKDGLQNAGEPAGDKLVADGAKEVQSDTLVDTAALNENFALRIGEYTRKLVDDAGYLFERATRSLNGLALVAQGEIAIKWDRVGDIAVQVSIVLLAAYAGFLLTRFVVVRFFPHLSAKARYGGGLARSFILVVTTLADAVTVGIGWLVGNGAALISFGGVDTGVTIQESLALNAFLICGMTNVFLRFIFAPRRPELRFLPFANESSLYWYRRLRMFMYWMIYGVFLAVPLANIAVSFVLGNALRFLVVLLGMLYLCELVRRNRRRVHDGTAQYAQTLQTALARKSLSMIGSLWHLAAYSYIAAVFIIWVVRPFDATTIILRATGLSILTIIAGIALSLVMTRAIRGGIRLPEDLNRTLPALQNRLNAFVPRLLKIIRFAVFVATVLLLLEIWGLLSVVDWLASEAGVSLLSSYGSAFLVVVISFMVWLAVMSWVDLRLQTRSGHVVTARERTLFQLFRNASTVVIVVMALLLGLSEIGVDIGPLIAGAGVVGLAISFGAQTLVKDIITGAFIQIENAINEGDVVTVAGMTGTVEGITVRSVRMRDVNGTTHIIPFSSVDMVSNFMRGFAYHVALIGVSYDTDLNVAKDAMAEAFRRLKQSELGPKIIDDFEMHGVTNFGASSIDIRGRIKTLPGEQWGIGRAYNEFVKQVFDERNIEIPFPQVTYHAATPPFADAAQKAKQVEKPELNAAEFTDDGPGEEN